MVQKVFAENAKNILMEDESVIGLAVAGSWLTNEIDEFSDLDLILVTTEKISQDKDKMVAYARTLGKLLIWFTGEHVGEPRLLICLYDNPLLHVDIKFVTLKEFRNRIETPFILLDKDGKLLAALEESIPQFPYPDYQWIEDRFWVWIHYAFLKIGRGEYVEAFDFLGFLRINVFGPLLHIKNNNLPRGVRKVETMLTENDLLLLKQTIPIYSKKSLIESLTSCVSLYQQIRKALFTSKVNLHHEAEAKVLEYLKENIIKH